MKTNKTQEQLYNRILINFGIGIVAYSILYFLYQKMYMDNTITFTLAAIFAVGAVVCYVLAKTKDKPLKNYGHMCVAFCLALLFTRLSVITATVIGMEKFIALQDNYLFKKLMQTRWEVILIVYGGAAYLVGMLVYNAIMIVKAGKKPKKSKKK